MCGVLGYFGADIKGFLEACSLDRISHRGPDYQSDTVGKNFYLGHTRLSILDTSNAAHQPIFTADASSVLVFNGEIYNHEDLREEYLSDITFRSSGDSETLLYGLDRYGVDFLNRLNGIFAFSFLNIKSLMF